MLSTVDGFQVPVNPCNEVAGNVTTSPLHIVIGLNVAATVGFTSIVPFKVIVLQPPTVLTVYGNDPDCVGVPLIVNTPVPESKLPLIPVGSPVTVTSVVFTEA